jgi:hypothetical protein
MLEFPRSANGSLLPRLNYRQLWSGVLAPDSDKRFVTVIGSSIDTGPQGQRSLTLWTRERGPISFALGKKAIQILREALCETAHESSETEHAEGG